MTRDHFAAAAVVVVPVADGFIHVAVIESVVVRHRATFGNVGGKKKLKINFKNDDSPAFEYRRNADKRKRIRKKRNETEKKKFEIKKIFRRRSETGAGEFFPERRDQHARRRTAD